MSVEYNWGPPNEQKSPASRNNHIDRYCSRSGRVPEGAQVRVVGVDGMVLTVEPLNGETDEVS